ncbi:MAG: hypothetical protein M3N00_09000 [Actinomycetota bacterium]|nr:hypothetical protein [Actinomycetota bacterium]
MSNRCLYEDDEVLEKVPVAALGKELLENTRPRPVSPYYSDMSRDIPVGQALQELQAELQNIVNQG